MSERTISYKGLTIISRPRWYRDQQTFGVLGEIRGIKIGGGGSRNFHISAATTFRSTEEEAHEQFLEDAKKHIDENGLGEDAD